LHFIVKLFFSSYPQNPGCKDPFTNYLLDSPARTMRQKVFSGWRKMLLRNAKGAPPQNLRAWFARTSWKCFANDAPFWGIGF
jgi:hypothetical protein